MSVNGSSATGLCSSITDDDNGISTCQDPASSVLFDRNIPTLTGLDGDMWARQLFTTHGTPATITFDFTETPGFVGVRRVEMVLFNCPQWEISVERITLSNGSRVIGTTTPTITSCDSLVRVCMPNLETSTTERSLVLMIDLSNNNHWLHIAEVTFYADSPTCPPDVIITTPTPPVNTMDTTDTIIMGMYNATTFENSIRPLFLHTQQ